jgi:hypothetical protein
MEFGCEWELVLGFLVVTMCVEIVKLWGCLIGLIWRKIGILI